MPPDFDLGSLSMTEIIRLQTLLTQELSRRFETSATICFTDIAGSTAYFARFGDAMGRQLQQLHIDRLEAEVERLESENRTLLERNLRLINGARVRQIPECDLDRPLAPINRNPTTPRARGGRT